MSYIDAFNKGRTMARQITGQNPLGTGAAIGSSPIIGKKKRPQTMAEWKIFADGLTRRERDQLYPGMHIDLIPAYEMITGGDPNWGAEGSELSESFDNTEQVGGSQAAGQYIWPFGGDEEDDEEDGPGGGKFKRYTGAEGAYGGRIGAGHTHPSYELRINFEPSAWLNRNKEYSSKLYLDGVEMGAPSSHQGEDGYVIDPGDGALIELRFSSPGGSFEITGTWTYE